MGQQSLWSVSSRLPVTVKDYQTSSLSNSSLVSVAQRLLLALFKSVSYHNVKADSNTQWTAKRLPTLVGTRGGLGNEPCSRNADMRKPNTRAGPGSDCSFGLQVFGTLTQIYTHIDKSSRTPRVPLLSFTAYTYCLLTLPPTPLQLDQVFAPDRNESRKWLAQ